MELTDKQLEKVREAARTVDYGSVTINISKVSSKLDLSVNRRIREDDPDEQKTPAPRKKRLVKKKT